jgi:hypothetical protein
MLYDRFVEILSSFDDTLLEGDGKDFLFEAFRCVSSTCKKLALSPKATISLDDNQLRHRSLFLSNLDLQRIYHRNGFIIVTSLIVA